MSNPTVSIVMPVYNAGIYIKDAIQDILHQTYTDFELICVDDGSTDQSANILRYFAESDERVCIITQDNQGAGAARNVGLDVAKGEYIWFPDADDRFETGLIEHVINVARCTNSEVVVFNADSFDSESGIVFDEEWVQHGFFPHDCEVFSYKDIPDYIFLFTPACVWNKLYKLDFIKEKDIKFQMIPYMNDVYFEQLTVAMAQRITVCEKVLLHYRKGQSKTVSGYANKKKNPQIAFDVLYKTKKQLEIFGIYETVKKSYANHTLGIIFSHLEMMNGDSYPMPLS